MSMRTHHRVKGGSKDTRGTSHHTEEGRKEEGGSRGETHKEETDLKGDIISDTLYHRGDTSAENTSHRRRKEGGRRDTRETQI